MKKILDIIFSIKTTLVLILLFTIAIATATFVENKYDTITADILIYDAIWFEVLIALLALNFLGNIKKYNLFKKEKLSGLIFHLAFIIMIIGAGITRYFGWDGEMRIVEGSESNIVYVAEPVLITKLAYKNDTVRKETPIKISQIQSNYFEFSIPTKTNDEILISYKNYVRGAIAESDLKKEGKAKIIELFVASNSGKGQVFIPEGEFIISDNVKIAYNMGNISDAININDNGNNLEITSPFELLLTVSRSGTGMIKADSAARFENDNVYNTQRGVIFQFIGLHKNTTIKKLTGTKEERFLDALILNVNINAKDYEAEIYGQDEFIAQDQEFNFDETKLIFAYGFKPHKLPFSIFLSDFTLHRYPGSESPSSMESKIKIIDYEKNVNEEHTISHNNVIDYEGYRFFQLSYDDDEKGTILSVNYDFWGTWVSYIGYILLFTGFLLTLFNKNTRFSSLFSKLKEKQI